MDRPKLERASWIAGIISAVLALVGLLLPAHHEQPNSQQPIAAPSPKPTSSNAEAQATTQSATPTDPTPSVSVCITTESITEGIRVAKTISSSIARDNAFAKLALSSLCNNDIELAHSIAALVNSSFHRDNLLGKIVERAAAMGRPTEALKIAEEMSSSTARDNVKYRLLDALNRKQS
jgi:hypothetical protein